MQTSLILAGLLLTVAAGALAAEAGDDKKRTIYQFQVTTIDGKKVNLAAYKGKVLIIVNVASECGYTDQYKGLQALYKKHAKDGLAVLAFPCNDFGGQEPDGNAKIKDFAKKTYGVEFDLFSKISILGKDGAPLYKFLTSKEANPKQPGDVKWNFEKFIISRDGTIAARFVSEVEPESEQFVTALRQELEKR
ncbi:MAG: glutathione peroxidase [Planctomycetes bacterium]|nr:glutathione peroxidase [Planctomycetota bacterium]